MLAFTALVFKSSVFVMIESVFDWTASVINNISSVDVMTGGTFATFDKTYFQSLFVMVSHDENNSLSGFLLLLQCQWYGNLTRNVLIW